MHLRTRMDLPPGAVLNLPLSADDFGLHSALQMFHGRPIATGYLARYGAHQMEDLKSLDKRMAGEAGEIGPWLTSAGFATVIVGGPISIVQQQQLHAVSLEVIFLNGRSDRHAIATFGSPIGVGDFPDQWRPEDRLTGTRTYETGAVRAKQIDVLADDNDTYVIDIFANDGAKSSLLIPAAWGGGLRWRALDLPPDISDRPIQRIEIRPGQGDGSLPLGRSFSEVRGGRLQRGATVLRQVIVRTARPRSRRSDAFSMAAGLVASGNSSRRRFSDCTTFAGTATS